TWRCSSPTTADGAVRFGRPAHRRGGVRRARAGTARGDRLTVQRGVIAGVTAYLIWGLFPLYWPLLEPAGALEILAHRMVWSLVLIAVVLILTRGFRSGPRPVGGRHSGH